MTTSLHRPRGQARRVSRAIDELEALTFQVTITTDRDRTLIRPVGELDLATAPILERRIIDLLQSGGQRLVVDLRAVSFIDSAGIHALVNAHQAARQAGRALSIIPGGPAIRRMFELVGVSSLFELEPAGGNGAD